MLKFRHSIGEIKTVSPDGSACICIGCGISIAELATPLVNRILKFKSKLNFFPLHTEEGVNLSQKLSRLHAANIPDVLGAMLRIALAMIVAATRASKTALKFFYNWPVSHTDASIKLHAQMIRVLSAGGNTNIALAIKETCNISNVHIAPNEKLANSEKARCPVERRGRVTPNQAGAKAPGVRREQVPTAKAKICSELGRNVERPAEMTGPYDVLISEKYIIRQQIATRSTFSSDRTPTGTLSRLATTG